LFSPVAEIRAWKFGQFGRRRAVMRAIIQDADVNIGRMRSSAWVN